MTRNARLALTQHFRNFTHRKFAALEQGQQPVTRWFRQGAQQLDGMFETQHLYTCPNLYIKNSLYKLSRKIAEATPRYKHHNTLLRRAGVIRLTSGTQRG